MSVHELRSQIKRYDPHWIYLKHHLNMKLIVFATKCQVEKCNDQSHVESSNGMRVIGRQNDYFEHAIKSHCSQVLEWTSKMKLQSPVI